MAKCINMILNNQEFNPDYDICWSFTYALTSADNMAPYGYGVGTFLCDSPNKTGSCDQIHFGIGPQQSILSIVIDDYGYYAWAAFGRDGDVSAAGVPLLSIRDNSDSLVAKVDASSLISPFSPKQYITLRFRLSEGGKKLTIDKRDDETFKYENITSVAINETYTTPNPVYMGIVSHSPSNNSTFYLKNVHIQGNKGATTVETLPFVPLDTNIFTSFTTMSGVSATPM